MTAWIDATVPISPSLVTWPGDPDIKIDTVSDVRTGDEATLRRLELGSHTGTHIDAPSHFMAGGHTLDAVPPDALIGPARVVAVDTHGPITAADLEPLGIEPGDRLLLRTRNSHQRWWHEPFDPDYIALSKEAAVWLVNRGVRLVGVDYLSVSTFRDDPADVHCALLGAGIWIVEGLDLTRVRPGLYDLCCLPMRIAGGDGAPVRAMLRPLSSS